MADRHQRRKMLIAADRKIVCGLVFAVASWSITVTESVAVAQEAHNSPPNVLFLCVDDWNDWAGCLGNRQAITPNVDRLAKRGVLFANAHCAAPVCNPSRVATLTGKRPERTGIYHNGQLMRKLAPSVVTLPQYFRAHGYHTAGAGKVFHDVPPHCHDAQSWSEYFWWNEAGPRGGKFHGRWRSPYSILPDPEPANRPLRKITGQTKRNFDWGQVDQPVSDWPDRQVTDWATEFLTRKHRQPFFLAVGIFRPHVPWFNPKHYFDLFPLEQIELPVVKANDTSDLGPVARRLALDPASKHHLVQKHGEWASAVQAYLASIAFADDSVGRVLDALERSAYRENTTIVFWSDHGYHLGEKDHWHKSTLWERSTRVPLIFAGCGIQQTRDPCSAAVNLLDIYPTLLDLCRLPSRSDLDGMSLTRLLIDPSHDRAEPSVTTQMPGNHAVRDRRWRYIRYASGEQELYDHKSDPHEWENLAGKSEYASVVRRLRDFLPRANESPR